VVDASSDVDEAERVSPAAHAAPGLRIGLLFCARALSDSLRPFLDAGIGSFLDL
jgi:hypothetical protein